MNTKFMCTLYNVLFKALPHPAWKAKLLDAHFSHCPSCQEKLASDDQLKGLLISPRIAQNLPEIWPYVNQHQEDSAVTITGSKNRRFFRQWKWQLISPLIGVFLVVVVLLFWFFVFSHAPEVSTISNNSNNQVIVKSVKINSKAAKYFFFHSKDPDKLIIWTQSNDKNGG